eukprot:1158587-Pelagomonas_calceolata.AAC.3
MTGLYGWLTLCTWMRLGPRLLGGAWVRLGTLKGATSLCVGAAWCDKGAAGLYVGAAWVQLVLAWGQQGVYWEQLRAYMEATGAHKGAVDMPTGLATRFLICSTASPCSACKGYVVLWNRPGLPPVLNANTQSTICFTAGKKAHFAKAGHSDPWLMMRPFADCGLPDPSLMMRHLADCGVSDPSLMMRPLADCGLPDPLLMMQSLSDCGLPDPWLAA